MATINHEDFCSIIFNHFDEATFYDKDINFQRGYQYAVTEIYAEVMHKMLENVDKELAAIHAMRGYESCPVSPQTSPAADF